MLFGWEVESNGSQLQADCLYTGISPGSNDNKYRMGGLYF